MKKINEKIGFYTPPFPRVQTYLDMLDTAQYFGVSAVEPINFFDFSVPDKELAKRIKEKADEKNIVIPCFSMYINLAEGEKEDLLQTLKAYADVASILKSPFLHHTIVNEHNEPDKVVPYKKELMKRGIELVREIYDYAGELGIKTVYEDQGYIFNGVENFGEFLSTVNRDVGVVADFGNIHQSKDSIEDFINAFSDRIVHVHLKDVIMKNDNEDGKGLLSLSGLYMNEVQIGKGSVNFEKCIGILKNIGYDGYYSIECGASSDNSPAVTEMLEYVRNLI